MPFFSFMLSASGVREVIGLVPVGDSDFFFVKRSCHVDEFTFHISLPSLKFIIFIQLTTMWGILKFSEVSYREFLLHLTFLLEFPKFSIEWFTFWKFNSFRIFWKLFQKIFLYHVPPFRKLRNFSLNGKRSRSCVLFQIFFSFSHFTSFFLSFFIQIAELKRGAEIIVCTPGRMIDMLTANNGKK